MPGFLGTGEDFENFYLSKLDSFLSQSHKIEEHKSVDNIKEEEENIVHGNCTELSRMRLLWRLCSLSTGF